MIIHIIDIINVAFVIPKNDPVVRTDLDRPESGIIARQTVNPAAQDFNIILRCHRIKGIEDLGNFRQIVGGKLRAVPPTCSYQFRRRITFLRILLSHRPILHQHLAEPFDVRRYLRNKIELIDDRFEPG